MKCETIEVKPVLVLGPDKEYEEDYRDVLCENEASATTEYGLRVCAKCAEGFRREGFRVDEDER